MRFVPLLLLCALGCEQPYVLPRETFDQWRGMPPGATAPLVVPAHRDSGEPVTVRLGALRFDGRGDDGWHASGNRLSVATRVGLAVLGVGLGLLAAGAISWAEQSPSLNPRVRDCESSGGWFCGLGEAVAGATLLGFGAAHVLVGGILAGATSQRRDAEVSSPSTGVSETAQIR